MSIYFIFLGIKYDTYFILLNQGLRFNTTALQIYRQQHKRVSKDLFKLS